MADGTFETLGPFEIPDHPHPRHVRVYLPRGALGQPPRPALFLFDGQNVFEDEGSFSGGWHAHAAVDRLRRGKDLVQPIVVGIDHGREHRISELSPWSHGEVEGKADAFLDWLVTTLVPLVKQRFPVREGPLGAVIGGSSMGGLGALYAHLRHPDVFGGAISMSPALWVGRGRIFDYVRERPRPYIPRIYLDAGGREAGGRMLAAAERMAALLREKGYPDTQLMWRPDARGSHNERAWRRRLPKALRFMFRISR